MGLMTTPIKPDKTGLVTGGATSGASVLYEMITKKKANQKFEMLVNNIGMAVLLSLIVVITAGDVLRLIKR